MFRGLSLGATMFIRTPIFADVPNIVAFVYVHLFNLSSVYLSTGICCLHFLCVSVTIVFFITYLAIDVVALCGHEWITGSAKICSTV